MKDRIRQLRKELKLTQQAFADRIGVKQNTVATYEIGRNPPTDTVLNLICREFNVSRAWLETGEGEMFQPMDRDAVIAGFVGGVLASEPDSFKRRLISALATLSEDDWAVLAKLAEQIVEKKEDQA